MPSHGESFAEALDLAYEAGFRTIEVVPADFQGNTGYPVTRLSVGINLDNISAVERNALAKSVSRFPVRTVHSMHRDLNNASRNPGIARESERQYRQCAEFAVKIGVQTVTFHPGMPDPAEQIGDEAFVIQRNVEFGKEMAEYAEKHNLVCGYENLGGFPTPDQMNRIIQEIGSPRFGLHFDVGHVWLTRVKDPLKWLDLLGRKVVSVHVHGTYHRPDRTFENHQSLELDDCTDWPAVMAALDKVGFDGPMILELLAKDIPQYLEMCARSRDILLEIRRNQWGAENSL